jgi:sugar lactone lactonase YvrE
MFRTLFALIAAGTLAAPQAAFSAETTSTKAGDDPVEIVAEFHGPMPTGVTVSREGRVFVNFPRWGDEVEFTVAEVKDGKATAYPSQDLNTTPPASRQAEGLVSVQSVVVDPADRLWLLDTGSIKFGPTSPGGPKLLCVDLTKNEVVKKIVLKPDVALKNTYLNDIRFDLTRGKGGVAFITDSGAGGLIVVDLDSGEAWRRLTSHPSTQAEPGFVATVEGKPLMRQPTPSDEAQPVQVAADGIAISADGKRLHYCALSSRKQYSIDAEALADRSKDDEAVMAMIKEEPAKRGASDGLESDAKGNLYLTDYENNAVVLRDKEGNDSIMVESPRLLWPDTLSVAHDGFLYITANQLHRQKDFHQGRDMRAKPYLLVRVRAAGPPVSLK